MGNKRSDVETSLYYCNSRYYNPEWGRWLNADNPNIALSLGLYTINGLNLYNYCFNNPIMYYDNGGSWPQYNFIKIVLYLKMFSNCIKRLV